MRRPFVLPLFVLALAIRSTAETRQAGNPELKYYADAYADHYGVPRALVHAIIAQESNWNPHALSTTERYLGCKQNLEEPVNDRFGCLFFRTLDSR